MAFSTAFFDGLLALSSLGVAGLLFRAGGRACELGGMGFLTVGVAAAVGTARFAGLEDLAPLHGSLSTLAATVGLPLVGVGYAVAAWMRQTDGRPVVLVSLVSVVGAAILLGAVPGYGLAVSVVAMLVVLVASEQMRRRGGEPTAARLGLVGAVLTLAAGAVGSEGELFGWPRLDLFHLMLAVANGTTGLALIVLSPPRPDPRPRERRRGK